MHRRGVAMRSRPVRLQTWRAFAGPAQFGLQAGQRDAKTRKATPCFMTCPGMAGVR